MNTPYKWGYVQQVCGYKFSILAFICIGFFVFLLVLPSLIDRLGDAKDQVRDQDQTLLLKIMDQASNPQVTLHCLCNEIDIAFYES